MFSTKCAMIGVTAFLLLTVGAASARSHKFLNFEVPGARETLPYSINDSNDVTGSYSKGHTDHGFVRTSDGTISTFDVPNALLTEPSEINNSGEIVGYFYDSSSISHGFLRTPDGAITTFDVPDAKSTFPSGLNDQGDVVGTFSGTDKIGHGFLRKNTGEFIVYDPEGSFATLAVNSINNQGVITGFFCSTFCGSEEAGFVRLANGTITSFSVEDAKKTEPSSVNSKGEISGRYLDCCGAAHSFVRKPNGKMVLFECSFVSEVNDSGWAVGSMHENGVSHGCLRAPDGTISNFDNPKAGEGQSYGTSASGINTGRYVTGWYSDSHGHYHGFIVRPAK